VQLSEIDPGAKGAGYLHPKADVPHLRQVSEYRLPFHPYPSILAIDRLALLANLLRLGVISKDISHKNPVAGISFPIPWLSGPEEYPLLNQIDSPEPEHQRILMIPQYRLFHVIHISVQSIWFPNGQHSLAMAALHHQLNKPRQGKLAGKPDMICISLRLALEACRIESLQPDRLQCKPRNLKIDHARANIALHPGLSQNDL